MSTTANTTVDTPSITDHAPLRYLQRVDSTEPYPSERLRAMFRRAHRVHCPAVEGAAYSDPDSDAILVVDPLADEIVTVLREGEL